MARPTFQFPPKSEENHKIANVCEHCRGTSNFTQLAANKLRNGIVHLAIDQFETCQQNGNHITRQDVIRLWKALVDVACKKDCGCAQALHTHVYHDEFNAFWEQTKIELAAGERLSKRQKKNLAKKSKEANPETEENKAPTLVGRQLAKDRRDKKNKARKKACSVSNLEHSRSTNNLKSQVATALRSDLGSLQDALPPILPPATPALPVDPATGLRITFTATLASHVKPAPK